MTQPRIVITLGDPAGVGPEVVCKALASNEIRQMARFLILGSAAVCEETCRRLGMRVSWMQVDQPVFDFSSDEGGCCPALLLHEPESCHGDVPESGHWSASTGRASLSTVIDAVRMCRQGQADAMVTGPICKSAWKKVGCPYPGHTELLAAETGCDGEVMMLSGAGLRVALVTVHEAIKNVPGLITMEKIKSIAHVLHHSLQNDFGIRNPRIAVLGLNPHAGEDGHMGNEEQLVIAPAVRELTREGVNAVGPLPADTVFFHAMNGSYDAVLAMYHDQGLGPLKTVAFDCGVNITLGLPIVRTSVDHGTAFDIAGKGTASAESCIEAIRVAVQMARARSI